MQNDINTKLLNLYKDELKKLPPTENFSIQPAHPFLLSIPNDCNRKIKVMIFGKETNGWLEDLDREPLKAMERYARFWIDKKSKYSKKGTFQHVVNKFQDMLDKEKVCCIWNNIIKIGKKKEKGMPPDDLIHWQDNWFEVIRKEVKLIKPDCLIFFTGPSYDRYIKKVFGEFETSKVLDKKTRQIAKLNFLESKELIAFRTYHPNYLRTNKFEKEFLSFFTKQIHSI
jgi:hypothetical protein